MKRIKNSIAKQKLNTILKDKESVSDFIYKIKENFNKEEFDFLMNDRTLCLKILKNLIETNNYQSWYDHTEFLLEAVIKTLFEFQNRTIRISLPLINYYLNLDNLLELYNKDIMLTNKSQLQTYFNRLPSFNFKQKTSSESYQLHHFITFQLIENISILIDYYQISSNQIVNLENLILVDKIQKF